MNKSFVNQCDIYTLLWCYYLWHSTTTETATTVSQFVLLVCLLWSSYHLYSVVTKNSLPVYFKGLNVLFLMYACYGLIRLSAGSYILPSGGSVNSFYSFKKVCISLLPIYSFYFYSRKGLLDLRRLRLYSIVFFAVAVMAYTSYYTKRFGAEMDSEAEYTNNTGYLFLAILPIVTFWRSRPLLFYAFWGVTTIMIVMAMKRGAILSAAIAMAIMIYYSFSDRSRRHKTLVFILTSVLISAIVVYVIWLFENSDYFMYRYNETLDGNASGRDRMFPMFIDHILSRSSLFSILFGSGFDGSVKFIGAYCHNDWFEVTIDHGFIGLSCLFYYWWCFRKNTRFIKTQIDYYLPIILILAITLCNTLYSFSITNMSIFVTSVLGFCLSKTNSNTLISN